MKKSVEASCHGKVMRLVASHLVPLGFKRAKSTFFVRPQQLTVEFIHLHKYSFAPSYRVHLGIRVLNDTFLAPVLNGPDSHAYTCASSPNGSRYDFGFRSDQVSVELCSAEIFRWCSEVGMRWFMQFRDVSSLLTDTTSPLSENENTRLQTAMNGESASDAVRASKLLFGLIED